MTRNDIPKDWTLEHSFWDIHTVLIICTQLQIDQIFTGPHQIFTWPHQIFAISSPDLTRSCSFLLSSLSLSWLSLTLLSLSTLLLLSELGTPRKTVGWYASGCITKQRGRFHFYPQNVIVFVVIVFVVIVFVVIVFVVVVFVTVVFVVDNPDSSISFLALRWQANP